MSRFNYRRGFRVSQLVVHFSLAQLVTAACAAPDRTQATPPTTVASTPTAVSAVNVNTTAVLAERGQALFATVCAACHGERGQGLLAPAVIGDHASFSRFGETARGYYDFVSANMPQNAPGSLSTDEYLAVTAYLLVQNNLIQPSSDFSEQTLDRIAMPH